MSHTPFPISQVLILFLVIKVSQWGRAYYAGVGYLLVAPQRRAGLQSGGGLYGFVFDAQGVCVAHGASARFVGKTLGEIATLAHNSQLDSAELLDRFVGAAQLGGGWVRYAWRNSAEEPLREKGAFITRLKHKEPLPRRAGSGGGGGGGGGQRSRGGSK